MDNIPIGQNRVQQAFPAEEQNKERFITSCNFVIYQLYLNSENWKQLFLLAVDVWDRLKSRPSELFLAAFCISESSKNQPALT